MNQTIELPKLRTFDLLSPSEQAAIRRHCQNVVALALRQKYGQEPSEEQVYIPEPAPNPKFNDAQKALMYGQLNTVKERKPTDSSRQWKRGPKPMMGSGARR